MAVVATDNFNRADAANPGANWAKAGGSTFNLRIVSNQLEANNDPGMMIYTARTADQDGEVGIALKTLATTAGQGMGPVRRGSIAANTGYFAVAYATGIQLYKVVADSYSQLGSTYSGTISLNDIISLRATGTSPTALTVYQNGVSRITASDSASPITSGGDGAFGSIDGAIHPTGDDWYVDDLTGTPSASFLARNNNRMRPFMHF